MTTPDNCIVGALVVGGTNLKLVLGKWENGTFIRQGELVKSAVPASLEHPQAPVVKDVTDFYQQIAQVVNQKREGQQKLFLSINFAYPVDEQGVVLKSLHKLSVDLTGSCAKSELEGRVNNSSVALVHDAVASLFASQAEYHLIVGTGFGGAVCEESGTLTNIEPGSICIPKEKPYTDLFPSVSLGIPYKIESTLVAGPGIVASIKRSFPNHDMGTLTTADCALLFDHDGNALSLEQLQSKLPTSPFLVLLQAGVSFDILLTSVREQFIMSSSIVGTHLLALSKCYPSRNPFQVSCEGSVMEKNPWYVNMVQEFCDNNYQNTKIKLVSYITLDPTVEVAMEGALREAGLRAMQAC
jgi:hexokinase